MTHYLWAKSKQGRERLERAAETATEKTKESWDAEERGSDIRESQWLISRWPKAIPIASSASDPDPDRLKFEQKSEFGIGVAV